MASKTTTPEPPIPVSRSELMGRVRQEHTAPELSVRRYLHRAGFRFRLHRKDLPGSPDVVMTRHRTVIFVHGCFWHRHKNCKKTTTPKTRASFWLDKFAANVARDKRNIRALNALGWRAIVVWECESQSDAKLAKKLGTKVGRQP